MKIEFGHKSVMLSHRDEVISGTFVHRPNGLFEELNAFWASLDETAQDELFSVYKEAYETISAGEDLDIAYYRILLDEIHSREAIEPFCQKLVYPKNAKDSYVDHKHYTPQETYTKPDYYELAILSIRLRSILPLLACQDLYVQHRSNSGNAIMYKTKSIIDKISDCEIFECDAFERLRVYVHATHAKMLDGQKGVNITGSILEAFGTEDLPIYLLGTSVVLGCIPTSITSKDTNVAKSINSKLRDELTKKITRRFNVVNERPFAKIAMVEDNNVGYFETYLAREQVPAAIPLAMGVWSENYRKARKAYDVELPPSEIKKCINSVMLNPYPQFTLVQQYLIKQTNLRIMLHQSIVDIPADMLEKAIGITQLYLIENRFMELARIMSSHARLINRNEKNIIVSSLSFKSLDADTKELLNRYYKAQQPNPHGSGWIRGYESTIECIQRDFPKFVWSQEATPEVCALLGTENGEYAPSEMLLNELGRFIAHVNARECNKLKNV